MTGGAAVAIKVIDYVENDHDEEEYIAAVCLSLLLYKFLPFSISDILYLYTDICVCVHCGPSTCHGRKF